ncbi:peptide-methionine (S)-S-oxide reductase MsrA [Patescibacteria group bacterium]|nr:peptide-methionine (S)-S-oxide reductase MsrA [Patescibacteria group bacterium]
MNDSQKQTAVFGGGCFWCTDAVFKMLKGVESITSGYAGGTTENPTYREVGGGRTGHAEVISIDFDSSQISFRDLMTVFFATHDATQLNRQGADVGTQYRSIILYTNEEQKTEAEAFIKELNNSTGEGDPVVTEVAPLTKFYSAEDYHQDYFTQNPNQSYCQIVIAPKLQHAQKEFAALLKTQSS